MDLIIQIALGIVAGYILIRLLPAIGCIVVGALLLCALVGVIWFLIWGGIWVWHDLTDSGFLTPK